MNPQFSAVPNISYSGYNIIVPIDKSNNKFNRAVYTPMMTEGKITSEEVNQVLNDLELVTKKLPTSCGNLMTIAHLFVLPFIAMWILTENWYCGYYDYDRYYTRTKSWSPFFIYCLIAFIYFHFGKKYQLMKVRNQADTIIQMHQSQFNKKGFRLFIPFNFPEWIEIQRDNYPQQMPMPNAHQYIVPQNFSQLLQIPAVQNIRQYGASALQTVASSFQVPQNNQGANVPLNPQNNHTQC